LRVMPGTAIEISTAVTWGIEGEFWMLGEPGQLVQLSGSANNIGSASSMRESGASLSCITTGSYPGQKCYGETAVIKDGYPIIGSFMRHVQLQGQMTVQLGGDQGVYADSITYAQPDASLPGTATLAFAKLTNAQISGEIALSASYLADSVITSNLQVSVGRAGRNLTVQAGNFASTGHISGSTINAGSVNISGHSLNNEVTVSNQFIASRSQNNRITLTGNATFSGIQKSVANYFGTNVWSEILTRHGGGSGGALVSFLPIVSGPDLFNIDRDGDTVPDYIDYDNDNDGFSDLQEVESSNASLGIIYDPWDANSHPDPAIVDKDADMDLLADAVDFDDDNDGTSDSQELLNGTDPFMADSDGDGQTDTVETDFGYDPLNRNDFPIALDSFAPLTVDSRNINANGNVIIHGATLTMSDFNIPAGTPVLFSSFPTLKGMDLSTTSLDLRASVCCQSVTMDETLAFNLRFTDINVSFRQSFGENLSANSAFSPSQSMISEVNATNTANSSGSSIDNSRIKRSLFSRLGGNGVFRSKLTDSHMSCSNASMSADLAEVSNSVFILDNCSISGNGLSLWDNVLLTWSNSFSMVGNPLIVTNADLVYPTLPFTLPLLLDASFDNVSFTVRGVTLDTGLGTPIDLQGNGVTDTVLTFTNLNGDPQTITVDGLNNPRSTRLFPNGESDLWNPSGVGAF
jgi:hypothetical protein